MKISKAQRLATATAVFFHIMPMRLDGVLLKIDFFTSLVLNASLGYMELP